MICRLLRSQQLAGRLLRCERVQVLPSKGPLEQGVVEEGRDKRVGASGSCCSSRYLLVFTISEQASVYFWGTKSFLECLIKHHPKQEYPDSKSHIQSPVLVRKAAKNKPPSGSLQKKEPKTFAKDHLFL